MHKYKDKCKINASTTNMCKNTYEVLRDEDVVEEQEQIDDTNKLKTPKSHKAEDVGGIEYHINNISDKKLDKVTQDYSSNITCDICKAKKVHLHCDNDR